MYYALMPMSCTICNHSKRKEIEGDVSGAEMTRRAIAQKYGVTQAALFRHNQHRVRRQMSVSSPGEILAHLGSLLKNYIGKENPEDTREIDTCIGLLSKALKRTSGGDSENIESLDRQIALLVRDATNGFEAGEISRLKSLVESVDTF